MGYLYDGSRGNRVVIADPVRWPLLRKAFDMLLSGTYTVTQIKDILNTEYGFKTRQTTLQGNRPLSRSGMYKIFNDPFYYGYFQYNGGLVKGSYQAMITVDEYDKIQLILGRNGRPRRKKLLFAYTGLMTCHQCGAAITASLKSKLIRSTGEIKYYTYYHCTKRKSGIKCTADTYITETQLEHMILAEMRKYELNETFAQWGLNIIRETYDSFLARQEELLNALRRAESKIKNELNQLVEMRIANEIDADSYKLKKEEKQHAAIRISARIQEMESEKVSLKSDLKAKFDFITNLTEEFKKHSALDKKADCNRFGWNWILNGKILLFSKHKWLNAIKNYKTAVTAISERLEPEKTIEKQDYKPYISMLSPYLLPIIDEVITNSNDNIPENNCNTNNNSPP